MSKGSALARAVRYFREADLDEVTVAFELVRRVVDERNNQNAAKLLEGTPKPKRTQSRNRVVSTTVKPFSEAPAGHGNETLGNA